MSEERGDIETRYETAKVSELIPYARNSRTHSDSQISQIAASIEEWGFVGAIVVRNGTIGAGHGRVLAVEKLNKADKTIKSPPDAEGKSIEYEKGTIPIIDASGWSDAQFKAFVIADNQLALNAGWDEEMLKLEIEDLALEDFDINALGFDEKFLQDMFKESDEDIDTNSTFEPIFEVAVSCKNEKEQELVYQLLSEKGYKCRVLSM